MSYVKVLVIVLIFVGETLGIYAELSSARTRYFATGSFLQIFIKMFLVMTVAGAFLISGYMLGFKSFQNIWIVSAISITSILIMEPIAAYAFFKQLPTTGALVGLILGALGFSATLFL